MSYAHFKTKQTCLTSSDAVEIYSIFIQHGETWIICIGLFFARIVTKYSLEESFTRLSFFVETPITLLLILCEMKSDAIVLICQVLQTLLHTCKNDAQSLLMGNQRLEDYFHHLPERLSTLVLTSQLKGKKLCHSF